ncbi:fatty acid hydroxylase [Chryseobacterium sp. T16E-39]|uniref:sterol desaturase family protein n=1 Tax=Chryseobacterium sp. T16E-39 TaxID=2015076 RepID=UPI000B5B1889|nr:sterol desaturase family protein [Chryseobacterium sp. T16E-39]ASK32634.1 fatty acid hydroxylase [Chryseobacterium sp. T16E-39]
MNFNGSGFSEYIKILERFTGLEWIGFSLVVNIALFLFSIGLYFFIEKTCPKKKIQDFSHPITRSDFYLSLLTVFCNCLVMLLGVFLWKNRWIELGDHLSPVSIFFEVVILILLMDFCMYLFHYAAHMPFVYKRLHGKHHEHVHTNFLSLFVLHPVETIGFGLMILALLVGYDFSVISITTYLFINLVWGTIGHLNKEFFPPQFDRYFVGTTQFHNQHHLDETKNFGFYTSIWDRIFKTYKK